MSSGSTAASTGDGTGVRWFRLFHRIWDERRLRYGTMGVVAVLVVAVVGVSVGYGREVTGVPGVAGHARSPAQVGAGYLTALAAGSAGEP